MNFTCESKFNPDDVTQQVTPSRLTEIIRKAGHVCLFLPRYHCELAPIERAWSFAKWYCHRYCEYTMDALRVIVPQALAMVTPDKVRQYFNNCFRICALYSGGMTLNEWLLYDQRRKNMNKKVIRCVELVKKGEECGAKMKSVLLELKKFNSVKKSSHRDFSQRIEKLVSIIDLT